MRRRRKSSQPSSPHSSAPSCVILPSPFQPIVSLLFVESILVCSVPSVRLLVVFIIFFLSCRRLECFYASHEENKEQLIKRWCSYYFYSCLLSPLFCLYPVTPKVRRTSLIFLAGYNLQSCLSVVKRIRLCLGFNSFRLHFLSCRIVRLVFVHVKWVVKL